jgi:hypothetical protein
MHIKVDATMLCAIAARIMRGSVGIEQHTSPKWVFVVRALVTVKGTGAAKDELNKM